jgi:hypothetical protein
MKKYLSNFLNAPGIVFFLVMLYPAIAGEKAALMESKYFLAEFPKGQEQAAQYYLALAEKAREEVNRKVSSPLEEQVKIVYCSTESDFLRASGVKPEHYLACASARKRMIYINGQLIRTVEPEEPFSIILHEYAHVYLGLKVAEPLPRWLNEGLAMHLARDWSLPDSFRLSLAHLLGKTIPFSRLESGFPSESSAISLAYLQSYSMTDFIMKRFFGGGGLQPFLRRLTDPAEGTRIVVQLQDPIIRKSLEEQWKKQLGSWWRNLFYILTSGSLLWFALASLFLFAYAKKRQQQKRQIKIWEEEEFDGSSPL